MLDPRRVFGNKGEAIARDFLEKKGWKILETQFRTRFGEIDLIAEDGQELVFVEVKTRQDISSGYPEESITQTKLRHIAMAAEEYVQEQKRETSPIRLDVIAILLSPSLQIQHIQAVDMEGNFS